MFVLAVRIATTVARDGPIGRAWRRSLLVAVVSAVGLGAQSAAATSTGWWPPVRLSPAGEIAVSPGIGIDGRGDVTAIWGTSTGPPTYGHVLVSSLQAGKRTWSRPLQLSSPRRFGGWPRIAVDSAGDELAAWQNGGVSPAGVKSLPTIDVAFRPRRGQWSRPVRVSDPSTRNGQAAVAINDQGTALVGWLAARGSKNMIEVSTCRVSERSCSAARALTRSRASVLDPQVAVDTAGQAIAVWKRLVGGGPLMSGGTRYRVVAAVSTREGKPWLRPRDLGLEVESQGEGSASGETPGPRLATDSTGDALVVWQGGSTRHIITESAGWHARSHSWGRARVVSRSSSQMPQVAVDPKGDATIVWRGGRGWMDAVEGRLLTGRWSHPRTISHELALYPTVAMDRFGTALAGWGGSAVQAAMWTRQQGRWGPSVNIAPNKGSGGSIQIGFDGAGAAFAVWQRPMQRPRGIVIESARYQP